jgi:O-antigen/teichoic acid export membrane protein
MRAESLQRDAFWMTAGQLASALLQAAYFVLLSRSLGSRQYGAFVGVVALVSVASQCSGLGMEMLLLRDLSRDSGVFRACWGRALVVTLIGAVLLVVGLESAGRWIFPQSLWPLLFLVAIADGLFGRIFQIVIRAFQATRYMRAAAGLPALMSGLRLLVAAAFVGLIDRGAAQPTAQAWVTLYWAASAAASAIAVGMLSLLLGGPRFERIGWRDLTGGLSFAFSNSAITTYNDFDKTLLVSAGQMEAAGIYAAAYRVVDVASTPIYSLFAAATPRFFRAGGESTADVERLMKRLLMRGLPCAVLLSAGLFLTAGWLPVLLGWSFSGSMQALRWLCLLPVLRLLHYTWGTAITASTSQWRRTATQAGAAATNLALCAWMIPLWSWRGAAAASLLTDAALVLLSVAVWRQWARRQLPATGVDLVRA